MKNSLKSQGLKVRPGTTVSGKWHHNHYEVVKTLGYGAIGTVFLAKKENQLVAIKMSEQQASITTEVNVLKALQKVQGKRLGPSLLDVDDWQLRNGKQISFYVMEYLDGTGLNTFLKKRGYEWIGILLLQILDDLDRLHREGWIFGDLKRENLIVTQSPPRLRWIDVGGTTKIGRAVKEYTEFYDRGYWGLGSRKADPSYDLFALAMVVIQIFYPNYFLKGKDPLRTLRYYINRAPGLRLYSSCLEKALLGKYTSGKEMKDDISRLLLSRKKRKEQKIPVNNSVGTNVTNGNRSDLKLRFMETTGIGIIMFIFYMIFVLLQ
ncbi:protein kinase domain-containing protein [Salirhabdus salicampi]|uniref:protein kinase domain-containing protein n=1 Tax=Salirhabdus salicampi TaxID=476102 RepID=UPI0020C40328|nr:protein kinase [Salirhabdus salicampi]MCP8618187.1 protein kinase [Salirhabdus salicampi]